MFDVNANDLLGQISTHGLASCNGAQETAFISLLFKAALSPVFQRAYMYTQFY